MSAAEVLTAVGRGETALQVGRPGWSDRPTIGTAEGAQLGSGRRPQGKVSDRRARRTTARSSTRDDKGGASGASSTWSSPLTPPT